MKPGEEIKVESIEGKKLIYIGNEGAYISERGWFIIGEKEQTPKDFDRQIIPRVKSVTSYEKAWEAAVNYIRKFPKETLLDQRKFYEQVYKPVRDKFTEVIAEYS